MGTTTTRARPTGVERAFDPDEIIVSKTDPRGHITYADEVFIRVSGYDEDELYGKPHNLIRHPDMPRAVFSLAWERLEAGQEILAYVVNLAKDGGHYWVLAYMTPTMDGAGRTVGYHSNRRWVPPATRRLAAEVYQRIRQVEQRESGARNQTAAGRAELDRILAEARLDYDEWFWSITEAGS